MGDAAFAGQGVVMETFQMSQTRAYRTGGTLVLAEQPDRLYDQRARRCALYGILHRHRQDGAGANFSCQRRRSRGGRIRHAVGGGLPKQFNKDVMTSSARRRGHNEADEPSVTQPAMYEKIKSHPSTRSLYAGV